MDKGKLLEELKTIAVDLTPVSGSRVVAGVRHGNKWIAFGQNSMKTHPMQGRFGAYPYLHAEIDALVKAKSRLNYDVGMYMKCSIYIARAKFVNNRWVFGCAKPCEGCMRALNYFKLKEVTYSEDG